jgi:hypothetical protein
LRHAHSNRKEIHILHGYTYIRKTTIFATADHSKESLQCKFPIESLPDQLLMAQPYAHHAMDVTASHGREVTMLTGLCLLPAARTIGQYACSAPTFGVGWRIIAKFVVIAEQNT